MSERTRFVSNAPLERWAIGFYLTLLIVHLSAAAFAVPLLMEDAPGDRSPATAEQGSVSADPPPEA